MVGKGKRKTFPRGEMAVLGALCDTFSSIDVPIEEKQQLRSISNWPFISSLNLSSFIFTDLQIISTSYIS